MGPTPEEKQRRWAAMRGCERMLSSTPPRTMREQLAALAQSSVDLDEPGDLYGDGIVAHLEERIAALLGKPAAVFFPTGTMAQQVVLRCWAQRIGNATVGLHPLSHLEQHERQAFARVSGLTAVWTTREPRNPTAEEILGLSEPVGVLHLELPLREPGFVLPTWDELVAVTEAARRRGARVHVDGARLWESTLHFGQKLPAIAALADSVYVSFYKTLGGLAGAALAGPGYLMEQARAWRHRYGGTVFQQWPVALSALDGLRNVLPVVEDWVRHARTVADALAELPGARVQPRPPHTHQFQLWLPHPAAALNEAALALAELDRVWFAGRWRDQPPTGLAMTELTIAGPGLALSAADVVDIGNRFLARLT